MAQPKIRHIYDGAQDAVSQNTGLDCQGSNDDPKLATKQSMKDECDINQITARYERTGILPELIRQDARYGDFSEVPDYQDALALVSLAEEQFRALDAKCRGRFQNDPAKFLEFATNPANLQEMVDLGLAEAQPSPPRQPEPAPSVAPESKGKPAKGTE